MAEGSEASFVSAVSRAAPGGSVVSDVEYASLADDAAIEEEQEAYLHAQVDLVLFNASFVTVARPL